MLLDILLHPMEYQLIQGRLDTEIVSLTDHSARVAPGSLFVCIKGYHADGHHYLLQAFAAGAAAVVVEDWSDEMAALASDHKDTAVVLVEDTMKAAAVLASGFYGNPASRLCMIGITGTKGKTTVASMLNGILLSAGLASGFIGTLGAWYKETLETPETTTPDAITLHRLLAEMEQKGCTHVILEVSSQSLMRQRVYGIPFAVAVFTNLSPDHIGAGEHKSLEEYRYWKSRLFTRARISVIHQGADSWREMAAAAYGKVIFYRMEELESVSGPNDHRDEELFAKSPVLIGRTVDYDPFELELYSSVSDETVDFYRGRVKIGLPGRYNQENALAAIAVSAVLKIPFPALQTLARIQIPGRTELLYGNDYQVVIDYAHNETSMENLLVTLRKMNPARLICVYGSGGNRSPLRRIGMGRAGGRLADLSVLTEDNSRNEPLEQILAGLVEGVKSVNGSYRVIPDRREAIRFAIGNAKPGDMIAIIGKGHENYQETGSVRLPFSDREEARLAMEME